MGITTTSVLTNPLQASFAMRLLSVPVPYMTFGVPCQKKTMPKNGGNIFRQRRYSPLGTAEVPLGNSGANPPPQMLSAVNIDAVINFYGTYVMINEQVTLTAQDRPLNEATVRLGVSARQTEDLLLKQCLESTLASVNATAGLNGDLPTEINRTDIDLVYRTLMGNSAKTFMDGMDGVMKIGSSPVRDAFLALGHTDLIGQIDACQGFTNKWNYPNQESTLESEHGCVGNSRFLLSPIGSKTPSASMLGADVYNIFYCGREAYSSISIDQYSLQFVYLPPPFSGPLCLNSSAGYKMAHSAVVENQNWIIKMRVTLA
jgi:N4-gp56 family major capsid protein